jgi:hypothetical protein
MEKFSIPDVDRRAEDWVSERDRRWFLKNPRRHFRVRRRIPLEFGDHRESYSHTAVVEIRPRQHLRQAVSAQDADWLSGQTPLDAIGFVMSQQPLETLVAAIKGEPLR